MPGAAPIARPGDEAVRADHPGVETGARQDGREVAGSRQAPGRPRHAGVTGAQERAVRADRQPGERRGEVDPQQVGGDGGTLGPPRRPAVDAVQDGAVLAYRPPGVTVDEAEVVRRRPDRVLPEPAVASGGVDEVGWGRLGSAAPEQEDQHDEDRDRRRRPRPRKGPFAAAHLTTRLSVAGRTLRLPAPSIAMT